MSDKKPFEMTVREFLEEEKKKGAFEIIEDPNFGLQQILLRKGFTEEQDSEMKMEKAWKLYVDNLNTVMSQMFTQLYKGMESWSERAPII